MKHVFRTRSESEADRIKRLLERNGIPALVTNRFSNQLRKYSMSQMGVFVYINSQAREARALISDASYRVKDKVDVSKYYKENLSNISANDANAYFLKLLGGVLVFVLLLSGLVIYAYS